MADRVFQKGDLIFAKMRGYPAWPARVEDIATASPNPKNIRYKVFFYGTYQTGFCKSEELHGYEEAKNKLGTPKKQRDFNKAMWEIENSPNITLPISNGSLPSSPNHTQKQEKSEESDEEEDKPNAPKVNGVKRLRITRSPSDSESDSESDSTNNTVTKKQNGVKRGRFVQKSSDTESVVEEFAEFHEPEMPLGASKLVGDTFVPLHLHRSDDDDSDSDDDDDDDFKCGKKSENNDEPPGPAAGSFPFPLIEIADMLGVSVDEIPLCSDKPHTNKRTPVTSEKNNDQDSDSVSTLSSASDEDNYDKNQEDVDMSPEKCSASKETTQEIAVGSSTKPVSASPQLNMDEQKKQNVEEVQEMEQEDEDEHKVDVREKDVKEELAMDKQEEHKMEEGETLTVKMEKEEGRVEEEGEESNIEEKRAMKEDEREKTDASEEENEENEEHSDEEVSEEEEEKDEEFSLNDNGDEGNEDNEHLWNERMQDHLFGEVLLKLTVKEALHLLNIKNLPEAMRHNIIEAIMQYFITKQETCPSELESAQFRLRFMRAELQLLNFNSMLVSTLSISSNQVHDTSKVLQEMEQVEQINLLPFMVKKHPLFVTNMFKLSRYGGCVDRWEMTEEQKEEFTLQAKKIREKAARITERIMGLFDVPAGKRFMQWFLRQAQQLRLRVPDRKQFLLMTCEEESSEEAEVGWSNENGITFSVSITSGAA